MDDQDYDILIIEIREDLLTQVTDICYQKYLKREMYKFLIECTHKALQQLVPLHFYTYDDSHKFAANQESWIADEEPLICKPDSWAKGNIPYNEDDIPKNKFQQTDNVISDYDLIKCDEYPTSHVFDSGSNTFEFEQDEEGAENTSAFDDIGLETDELEPVTSASVQFNNYELDRSTGTLPSLENISIQPNRMASENTFYKIMKVNKTSNNSIQTVVKGRKTNTPAWTTIDEIRHELKTHVFGQNRYLQMRRECWASAPIDRKLADKQ